MAPYYERDGITIYCGDCLEAMPGLDGTFDAIMADLPYGTTACSWDTIIPLDELWIEYKRLIKDKGPVVLTGSQPFTTDLIMSNREWFKYEWIWDKKTATGGQNSAFLPMKAHENIIVFCDGVSMYNPQMERLTINEIKRLRKKDYNRPMGSSFGNAKMIVKSRQKVISEGGVKFPRSLLKINGVHSCSSEKKNGLHPTQKPVALFAYLIRTYTNPGDIILDNTMGSGTTLLAAQNEGRRAVGIELSEEYCKIAVERLRQPSFFSLPTMATKEVNYEQVEF